MKNSVSADRRMWLVGLAALLAGGGYLLFAAGRAGWGFPLDDAWIHQTYARSLAQTGEWAFMPGRISGGSTAPLWSGLLAPGYWLGLAPFGWTFLLGFATLAGLAWLGQLWADRMAGSRQKFPWTGLFLAGEWHLVWAAFSGMETIAYGLAVLAVFWALAGGKRPWLVGGLVGAAIWLRPDAITLLGPALFVAYFEQPGWRERGRAGLGVLLPVGGSAALYGLFNLATAGSALPTTFFAKQAEYSILLQTPLAERIGSLLTLPAIGPGILLVPGVVLFAWQALRRRRALEMAVLLWWLGFTLVYALRLPVTYQYGRYLVPAMPVFFGMGLAGLKAGFEMLPGRPAVKKLALLGGRAALAGTWLLFCAIGALRYAADVGIINTEMGAAAAWIKNNTPAGAVIAVHDIGAVGYFSGREIIDLAGLVSPDVIPIIRDEKQLAGYLDRGGASYLVTFPGWYPELTAGRQKLYSTGGTFAPAAGGENMAIYAWP